MLWVTAASESLVSLHALLSPPRASVSCAQSLQAAPSQRQLLSAGALSERLNAGPLLA
jgi:hypothetical protein